MKKLVSILLLLCIFCSCALADASDLLVKESTVKTYMQDGKQLVYVVFKVENAGKDYQMPDVAASVLLTDKDEIFLEATWPMLFPVILAPGESGYVANFYELNEAEQALYDQAQLRVMMGERGKEEKNMIAEMAKLIPYPQTDYQLTENGVTVKIKKAEGGECMLLVLCRNQAGEIITFFQEMMLSVPQGEVYEHTYGIPAYVEETVANVEIVCFALPI